MSFAYMPFFTGDYLRDTRHLSMMEHGAYLLMLSHCWDSKGPMPLDERRIFAICNARSNEEMGAVRAVLGEFFVRMEDGWYQPRMQREVERSENISAARSEAGKRGYEAKAKHLPSKSQASAEQVTLSPSPSPSLTLDQKEEESSPRAPRKVLPHVPFSWEDPKCKQLSEIPRDFALPDGWGSDAESLGWASAQILKEAERFRIYWSVGKGSGKRRTPKGWRTAWVNWLSKAERIAA